MNKKSQNGTKCFKREKIKPPNKISVEQNIATKLLVLTNMLKHIIMLTACFMAYIIGYIDALKAPERKGSEYIIYFFFYFIILRQILYEISNYVIFITEILQNL